MNLKSKIGTVSTTSQADILVPVGFSVVVNKLKIQNNDNSTRIINVWKYDNSLGVRILLSTSNYNLPAQNRLILSNITLENGDLLEADVDSTTLVKYDINYVEFTEMVSGGVGNDPNAIHDNESDEIISVTEKVTPISTDVLIIEDSENTNAKKRVQIGNLPISSSGVEIVSCEASEILSGGDMVNIYYDSSTLKCRKTDITNGYIANGFTRTAIGVVPAVININVHGVNDQLTGLSEGSQYFLGSVNGKISTTPPSGSGEIRQKIGWAIATDKLIYEQYEYIVLI